MQKYSHPHKYSKYLVRNIPRKQSTRLFRLRKPTNSQVLHLTMVCQNVESFSKLLSYTFGEEKLTFTDFSIRLNQFFFGKSSKSSGRCQGENVYTSHQSHYKTSSALPQFTKNLINLYTTSDHCTQVAISALYRAVEFFKNIIMSLIMDLG